MEKLLLTIQEVCELVGLGRSTVYKLLDSPNGFPTVRVGRRAVRIPSASVEQWVEKFQQPNYVSADEV